MRLEAALAAGKADEALIGAATGSLADEIHRHFAFEETQLFPRLDAGGEGDIAALLAEEHAAIRSAGAQFIALARSDPRAAALKPLGLELAERLVSHVQKEEMSLLPALEDLLDEDADAALCQEMTHD